MKTPDAPEDQIEPAIEHRAPRRQTTGFNNLNLAVSLASAVAVGVMGGALSESKRENSALKAATVAWVQAEARLELDNTASLAKIERDDTAFQAEMEQIERRYTASQAKSEQLAWDMVIASTKRNEPALCVPTCKKLIGGEVREKTKKEAKAVTRAFTFDELEWETLIRAEKEKLLRLRNKAATTGNDCVSICEKLNKEVCAKIAAVSQTEAAQTTMCNPAGKTTSANPTNEK